jgi:hypothetical protein
MTNSEIVEYISRFFSLLSFWVPPCLSMHILHLLFVLCSFMYSHRNSSLCISCHDHIHSAYQFRDFSTAQGM